MTEHAALTNIEGVVLAHFACELPLDPLPHLGLALFIEPAKTLHFSDNPFTLALLCKNPGEAYIVRSSPERKVEQEEYPCSGPR